MAIGDRLRKKIRNRREKAGEVTGKKKYCVMGKSGGRATGTRWVRKKKKKEEPYSGPESAHNQDGSPNPDFVKWADRPENYGKPGAKGGEPLVAPAVADGLIKSLGPPTSDALFPKDKKDGAKKASRKKRGGFNKKG